MIQLLSLHQHFCAFTIYSAELRIYKSWLYQFNRHRIQHWHHLSKLYF